MEMSQPSGAEVCVNCLECVHACPEHLLPNYLFHIVRAGRTENLEQYGLKHCTECGLCDETCPPRLPLLKTIKCGKQLLGAESLPDPVGKV